MATRITRLLTALALVLVGLVGSTALAAPTHAADVDCSDFSTQADAQRYLFPGDPNRLDADGDGRACDSLACPCSSGNPVPPKPKPAPAPKPQPKPQANAALKVVRVLKGDVVTVRLGNAKAYNVHLLGAVVPKSSCEAKASKQALKRNVKTGDVVQALISERAPNRDSKGVLRFLIDVKGKYNIGLSQVGGGYAKADKSINYDFKAKYVRVGKKAKAAALGYYATC